VKKKVSNELIRDRITNKKGSQGAISRLFLPSGCLHLALNLLLAWSWLIVVSRSRTSRDTRGCQQKNRATKGSRGRGLWSWWEEGKNNVEIEIQARKLITWRRGLNGLGEFLPIAITILGAGRILTTLAEI